MEDSVKYISTPIFDKGLSVQKMTLIIYNTLTRNKEQFIPVEKGTVKMYVCGMTVYSDAHIGHARTYYSFDVIRRYFEYKGYKVTYVQNITDVDDKIIAAANRENVDALEYSRKFTEKCFDDLDKLGIRRADVYPKASETVDDMIDMTQMIIDKGYGYETDGDVYFSVEKFKEYGKLSGQKLEEMKVGARVELGEIKKNHYDFALWKKAKPGEPSWDSPWGKGRPGWHIECSTMSSKYLGLPFDIHGGGMDLRFPHHENEIAQAEAATGKQFAKYWVHVGLLTVDGEKMSKSLGNIVNVKDLLKSWNPEVIRFFFTQTHYRSPPDFNENALSNAEKGLQRIHRLKDKLEDIVSKSSKNEVLDKNILTKDEKNYLDIVDGFKVDFEKAMDDDFNSPEAVAAIFDFVNKTNRFLEMNSKLNESLCKYALTTLIQLGNILGLLQPVDKKIVGTDESVVVEKLQAVLLNYEKKIPKGGIEELMNTIIAIREKARNEKNWKVSDDIRKQVQDIGYEIQDTQSGSVWRKK